MSTNNFGGLDHTDEEFESIEAFFDYLDDCERESFTHHELKCLNYSLSRPTKDVLAELRDLGLTLELRVEERKFRTFSTSPHDRWFGPGSSPTHGGSGWEQIGGMAGQAG